MDRPDDDDAIREGAAIGAISARLQIAVAGSDRASFLQGLLTNDIQALVAGTGCYSAWLTPQGRMLTDMHVLESGSMIMLDVPAAQAEPVSQRLEQFLFSEDVQIGPMAGSLGGLWLHGPAAAAAIEDALDGVQGLADWPDYHHVQAELAGQPLVVARISQLGVPGFCLYGNPAHEETVLARLRQSGAQPVSQAAIDAARIEAGYPV